MIRETLAYIDEKIHRFCDEEKEWVILEENPRRIREKGPSPFEKGIQDLLQKGFIVIDKPPGPTSHEVVAWIKRMLNLRRAGHSGTLEPTHHLWAGRPQGDRRPSSCAW